MSEFISPRRAEEERILAQRRAEEDILKNMYLRFEQIMCQDDRGEKSRADCIAQYRGELVEAELTELDQVPRPETASA